MASLQAFFLVNLQLFQGPVKRSSFFCANLKKKEQFFTKTFLKFSKFQSTLCSLNTFKKVSVVEFLVRWAVDCGRINLSKGNSRTYVFSGKFLEVFGAAISKYTLENICDGVQQKLRLLTIFFSRDSFLKFLEMKLFSKKRL